MNSFIIYIIISLPESIRQKMQIIFKSNYTHNNIMAAVQQNLIIVTNGMLGVKVNGEQHYFCPNFVLQSYNIEGQSGTEIEWPSQLQTKYEFYHSVNERFVSPYITYKKGENGVNAPSEPNFSDQAKEFLVKSFQITNNFWFDVTPESFVIEKDGLKFSFESKLDESQQDKVTFSKSLTITQKGSGDHIFHHWSRDYSKEKYAELLQGIPIKVNAEVPIDSSVPEQEGESASAEEETTFVDF